jgi:hypothetical protein
MPSEDRALREQLIPFLRGRGAHADLDTALQGFPPEHYGTRPQGSPHSAWELLYHIRFTLHDLIDFCTNERYVAPKWPDEYWPAAPGPSDPGQWNQTLAAIRQDIAEFERLVGDPNSNLYATIPWGDGQTLLREVLLAGDHTSYHLGQIVLIRKLLDIWQS